jgi:hypothetical protein
MAKIAISEKIKALKSESKRSLFSSVSPHALELIPAGN